MGHERVGSLPATSHWRGLVNQIAKAHLSDEDVSALARRTIELVRTRLRHVASDDGVK